jgi:hypothetical protein
MGVKPRSLPSMQGLGRDQLDPCSSIGSLSVAELLENGESRPIAMISERLGCAGRPGRAPFSPNWQSASAFSCSISPAECPHGSGRALVRRLSIAGGSAGVAPVPTSGCADRLNPVPTTAIIALR